MDEKKVQALRTGGKILGNLFRDLKKEVKPGITGKDLDAWVRREIVNRGAKVAYDMLPKKESFPGAICISVNEEIIHGTPKDIPLELGDKVSFDLDIFYQGYFTDSAFTMIVGGEKSASPAVRKMLSVTEEAMWSGIEQVKAGAHVGDIGFAVEKVLKRGKLDIVDNYVGHGIGKEMHMPPEIPNYGKRGRGYKLKTGDVICIEPMSCLGKAKNFVDKSDNWTVKTKDGSIACHVEHTVLVLDNGYEVLTA